MSEQHPIFIFNGTILNIKCSDGLCGSGSIFGSSGVTYASGERYFIITFIPHRQLKGDSPSAALRGAAAAVTAAAVASAAVAAASAAEAAVFAGWRSEVGFGKADARPKARRRRTRRGR